MPRSSRSRTSDREPEGESDLLASSTLPEWVITALGGNGVKRFSQLSHLTDRQLLELRGIGLRSVELIRTCLNRRKRRRRPEAAKDQAHGSD